MTVGEKIKKYRLEKGMTQEELGKYLGVGKAAVQKYESGQVQNLKSAHIKKLCTLFDTVPWDFIFDDESNYMNDEIELKELSALRDIVGGEWFSILEQLWYINDIGQTKIKEYICDIAKINEYRK